jgi:hypothetical protein
MAIKWRLGVVRFRLMLSHDVTLGLTRPLGMSRTTNGSFQGLAVWASVHERRGIAMIRFRVISPQAIAYRI